MQTAKFVPYAGFVSDVKKTYSNEYLKAQHAIGVHVRHYKEWDKTDLITLYDSYFGKVIFHHLVHLVSEAQREEQEKFANPGLRIPTFAQNDLTEIAPRGLNWKGYERLILEAVAEIENRSKKAKSELIQLFDAPSSLHADRAETNFDAQTALAELEESMVTRH